MRSMRAKMTVRSVEGSGTQESVKFACVGDSSYSGDGNSENNE
ncbi:MAG: hypothetical protein JWM95_1726 [Gemmatimonadetes bacterium]|nr:hypothetical protein [Gemmatimonadota bacterium]